VAWQVVLGTVRGVSAMSVVLGSSEARLAVCLAGLSRALDKMKVVIE
jgi:hypothetical protein